MKIIDRVNLEADYILKTRSTIRKTAQVFNVSKSTVHKDMKERLPKINKYKYEKIKKIMEYHIDVRHIRGGISTKNKYLKLMG